MSTEQVRSDLYYTSPLLNRKTLMAYLRSSSVDNTGVIVLIVGLLFSRIVQTMYGCKNRPASKGVFLRLDG